MSRPIALDLFCCGGGSSRGYDMAGYEVYGVELDPKRLRDYPYPYLVMDAIEALVRLNDGEGLTFSDGRTLYLKDIALIHASPPCQKFSSISAVHGVAKNHPDLIDTVRQALFQTVKPYVIENVVGAPLINPAVLCGSALGLGALCHDGQRRQLRRHRLFETSFFVMTPPCQHKGEPIGVYGNGGGQFKTVGNGGVNRGYMGSYTERCEAMGIDWMRRSELTQAIPPVMCEYIGKWSPALLAQQALP